MGELVMHPVMETIDKSVNQVINDEVASKLESAVVIGWDKNDGFYFDCTHARSGPDVLWLLKVAEQALMQAHFKGEA